MSDATTNVQGELARMNSLLRAIEPLCEQLADAAACHEGAYEALTAIEACVQCAQVSLAEATKGVEAMMGGDHV